MGSLLGGLWWRLRVGGCDTTISFAVMIDGVESVWYVSVEFEFGSDSTCGCASRRWSGSSPGRGRLELIVERLLGRNRDSLLTGLLFPSLVIPKFVFFPFTTLGHWLSLIAENSSFNRIYKEVLELDSCDLVLVTAAFASTVSRSVKLDLAPHREWLLLHDTQPRRDRPKLS